MAEYKNVENIRNLFDEEFKKTRKLIQKGESHLDNLAEGFAEADKVINRLPTADVVEVVKVAEILSDIFGDECPCNYNNIDEWLPYVCEYGNTCDCPCVKGWEQLIKHYGERRCEE